MIRRPTTVEEAIQIADSHDLAVTQDVVTHQPVSVAPVSNTGTQPMELDSIAVGKPVQGFTKYTAPELERLRATGLGRKLNAVEIGRLKATRACFYCYKIGHMKSNCRAKGNSRVAGVATTSEVSSENNESQ